MAKRDSYAYKLRALVGFELLTTEYILWDQESSQPNYICIILYDYGSGKGGKSSGEGANNGERVNILLQKEIVMHTN